jgi:predicted RND superfamily exporter protein
MPLFNDPQNPKTSPIDICHANSLQYYSAANEFLISLRSPSLILILDSNLKTVRSVINADNALQHFARFKSKTEITAFFWIIKVLCTTVGETFADYLNNTLGFGLNGTTVFTVVALAVALFFQFRSQSYKPVLYWLVVVLISIAGTLFTDNLTDNLNILLLTSSLVWALLLVIKWRRTIPNMVVGDWELLRPASSSLARSSR